MRKRGLHCNPSCASYIASAYVSIRQHTSAYVSIRQHTSAYVIRQHTSAYLRFEHRSTRTPTARRPPVSYRNACLRPHPKPTPSQHTSAYVSILQKRLPPSSSKADNYIYRSMRTQRHLVSIRQHTSANGSIRQHTSAYGSIRQHTSTPTPTYMVV